MVEVCWPAAFRGDSVHHGKLIDLAVFEREGEVAAISANGPAELKAVTLFANGRAAEREGIFGVEEGGALGGEERAVELGLAGLGVDLDAAALVGRTLVFGGEEVGVDADEGDGGFGRDAACALESVDGDEGLAGSSACRCGEHLELAGELVGIVGHFFQVGAGEGLGAGKVRGGGALVVADGDLGFDRE